MNDSSDKTPTFSIGAVARLTGLTTHTLRMWEHRYQAVVAAREANGRRIYSPADVEKLSLLKALTDHGTPISSIAGLDTAALHERIEQERSLQAPPFAGTIRAAVMGASLPGLVSELAQGDERIEMVVSSVEPDQLKADLKLARADVLLLEWPVLDHHTSAMVRRLAEESGMSNTIVAYRFARSDVLEQLSRAGIMMIRSPVSREELAIALFARLAPAPGKASGGKGRAPAAGISEPRADETTPARRYTPGQLARLSNISSSSIDCECPKHLAEILTGLGAFEKYSQQCEDLNDEDAALHAYLHASTARARAVMEDALAHLAEIENLPI